VSSDSHEWCDSKGGQFAKKFLVIKHRGGMQCPLNNMRREPLTQALPRLGGVEGGTDRETKLARDAGGAPRGLRRY